MGRVRLWSRLRNYPDGAKRERVGSSVLQEVTGRNRDGEIIIRNGPPTVPRAVRL